MHKNVEIVIGRLATDPGLRIRFAEDPRGFLSEQGLELSEIEASALAATDPTAFRALAEALDARLKKASRRPVTETRSETDCQKERKR